MNNLRFAPDLPLIEDLQSLFINNIPLLDVRAPVEFAQGAFPMAENLPLINDEERHRIGTRYKEHGQDEAVTLGVELVSGDVRQQRMNAWAAFIKANPHGALYCFRGGMRSKITQQWIFDQTGIMYPRIKGGYKAMRRYLIDNSERQIAASNFIVLSGRTGSGKTNLLNELTNTIDLEGLANHRGSAFGGNASAQPTQISFENNLAITQLKLEQAGYSTVVLEDEGRNIGSIHLPQALHLRMRVVPLVLLEQSLEERVQVIVQDYTVDMLQNYRAAYGDDVGFQHYGQALLGSLDKIQKRLGGERYQKFRALMKQAIREQEKSGSPLSHYSWVSPLMTDYYDPMYDYQISHKRDRIIFTGNRQEVAEYLQRLSVN